MMITTKHNKPRLLFISRACSPHAGGMERLSHDLIKYFLSTLPNHTATIIRSDTGRLGAILFTLRTLPLAIKKARAADVIHLGDPVLSIIGWIIKKLYQKPIAVTVHGLDVSYPNAIYRWYLKLFFQSFDLYLPISQGAAHALHEAFPNRRLSTRQKIINPGLHDSFYNSSLTKQTWKQDSYLTKIPRDSDTIHLCTIGRLVPRKGHVWFITNVFSQLPSHVHYLIAGQGPEEKNIAAAARRQGCADRVHLLGRVPDRTLTTLYNTIDIFIQPNLPTPRDAEGFGLVLLEAALCDRLVLAANLDGIPDAIHHQQNGLLLPPGDANVWQQTILNLVAQIKSNHPRLTFYPRQYTKQKFLWSSQGPLYIKTLTSLADKK